MTKITKQAQKTFIRLKLKTDSRWALKALITIYTYQTIDEQMSECTSHDNGVGFSAMDAGIMSSFASQYQKYGRLSSKQMAIVHKYMPRYWGQILRLSDMDKINETIMKEGVGA